MATLAIKLDPSRMQNADLDVRYEIPDRIAEHTDGAVSDEGFDYIDGDSLVIYLGIPNKDQVAIILRFLQDEEFCGNKILEFAKVGLDSGTGFRTVYPVEFDEEVFYGTAGS